MKKEIGGYLELEEFSGSEYYPNLYKANLGRTALVWLLRSRKCKKLLLPEFLCDSVIDACAQTDTEISFYALDDTLTPLLDRPCGLRKGEYLYLVNYYGQLTDDLILQYQKKYDRIIVDHTHGFYQRPLPGIDTIYSCRKFFGLSDGAYLATDAKLIPLSETDHSNTRMEHILGRYEHDAGTYYQQMLKNASAYHQEEPKYMSRLTCNLLRGIDYDRIKEQREKNYQYLHQHLNPENFRKNPFIRKIPEGPFAYPYYSPKGIQLRKELAKYKIFIPTNWGNVLKSLPNTRREYDWAANILPLPCDQRYGMEEMNFMIKTIEKIEKEI